MNKRYLTPAQIYYSLANLRQITFIGKISALTVA